MLIFGGGNNLFGAPPYLNDVWALSLTGAPVWTRLEPAGAQPPPRTGQCAIYDPTHDAMRFNHQFGDVFTIPKATFPPLGARIGRYLSPPLFPLTLRQMPCRLELHDAEPYTRIGSLRVRSDLVCHPGPTVGYRITSPGGKVLAYLPDHEPALGVDPFPASPEWTSGFDLAHRADLLVHDAQYTDDEYRDHVGWGHSSIRQLAAFARMAEVTHVAPFHHDPSHSDAEVDALAGELAALLPGAEVLPGAEGATFDL